MMEITLNWHFEKSLVVNLKQIKTFFEDAFCSIRTKFKKKNKLNQIDAKMRKMMNSMKRMMQFRIDAVF